MGDEKDVYHFLCFRGRLGQKPGNERLPKDFLCISWPLGSGYARRVIGAVLPRPKREGERTEDETEPCV